MNHIGKRIAEIRRRIGVNQIEFAELFDVSQSALKNYERGAADPPTRLLKELCLREEVSADWLLLGKGTLDTQQKGKFRNQAVNLVTDFLSDTGTELDLLHTIELVDLIEDYFRTHIEPSTEMPQTILQKFTNIRAG